MDTTMDKKPGPQWLEAEVNKGLWIESVMWVSLIVMQFSEIRAILMEKLNFGWNQIKLIRTHSIDFLAV